MKIDIPGDGLYLVKATRGRLQYVQIPEDALDGRNSREQVWERFLLPAWVALLQVVRGRRVTFPETTAAMVVDGRDKV